MTRLFVKSIIGSIFLFCLLILPVSVRAQAVSKQIQITTKNYNGGKAIQEALDLQSGKTPAYEQLTVYIQGGTYDITSSLLVYGNTRICADGDTFIRYVRKNSNTESQGRAPIISNACSGKGGYEGASNITVEGGTWDFQGQEGGTHYGMTMEAFRFAHGRNFRIQNVTMQNLYRSHFITIEGVENVEVKGCEFHNYSNSTVKKEAIHIDCMHNENMAPSNQDNMIYDDTICNHISISNCDFSRVPRGIGTHVAVAGLFPSDIVISNNTFSDITYEAIKAYHYKNVLITGNTITRAGCGIKCYLYSADSDKDEESRTNYLPALEVTKTEAVPTYQNIIIQWNTIREITDEKIGYGIQLAGNAERMVSDVTVAYNVITISGVLPATKRSGIYVKYGNNIRLISNRIYRSGETGILISYSSGIAVRGNAISSTAGNGLLAKTSQNVTCSSNKIAWAGKRSLQYKQTKSSRVEDNVLWRDKTGGIALTAGSDNVCVYKNKISNSGKNALCVSDSKQALINGNKIISPRNFGIYTYKADKSRIDKNQVSKSKSTAIIASNGREIVLEKNRIDRTGKYGILFTSAKKCYARNNTISRTKNYGIIFSANSKNKKQNLNYPHVSLKQGKKEITGYTYRKMWVRAIKGKKIKKTVKTKKDGKFVIKVPKLKKKQMYVIRVKDKLGNSLQKQVTVKV